MNWSVYLLWNHFHWTQILFVVVIALEMGIALYFCRPKIHKKVDSIDKSCQKVSYPIIPISIPRNRSTDTETNKKANP